MSATAGANTASDPLTARPGFTKRIYGSVPLGRVDFRDTKRQQASQAPKDSPTYSIQTRPPRCAPGASGRLPKETER